MRKQLSFSFFLLLTLSCSSTKEAVNNPAIVKPNILFLAIDDLRPELGCYSSDNAITPNLDAIAKNGLRFNRVYCLKLPHLNWVNTRK